MTSMGIGDPPAAENYQDNSGNFSASFDPAVPQTDGVDQGNLSLEESMDMQASEADWSTLDDCASMPIC